MLQEYKYYTGCMRAIIWTNDARIIVKRPGMLSSQSVVLYKTCKPKPRLSTHVCVTRPQWVKTEKDNELPITGRFSNQIGFLDIQYTRGILRFGVIFSKSVIYKKIVRHTAHTIVSWHFPKQWLTIHSSDLMMIIRLSTHSHNHDRRIG